VRFETDAWESFDASVPLTADGAVRLVPTPGHTRGHLSVAIETGDELLLIAGDASYSERTLRSGVVDGVAEDAHAHRDSSARIRELCGRRKVVYLPAHDSESPARLEARTATSPPPGRSR
jgi:glyoxylase-like metal-dependent hydrolase (beta-lactamase superfamily II)